MPANWNVILSGAVAKAGAAWRDQVLAQAERLGVAPEEVACRAFRLGLGLIQAQQRSREKRAKGGAKR